MRCTSSRSIANLAQRDMHYYSNQGTYDLDITVDYYVQALGLGRYPDDVIINGAVQSITTTSSNNVANKVTTMFWRGAENFKVVPKDGKMIYWAVSQAAPYRRMHVVGDINFDKGSWASGGVLANSIIEGRAGLNLRTAVDDKKFKHRIVGRWKLEPSICWCGGCTE